ncbi:MAG: Single-stranded DNA-binding protein [Myxococcota bacterium]|nr:Single-stranded DNA-binding protein [Myxococcota bacterium]
MASMNKVILIGNLGADPEYKVTSGGSPVMNFSVATTEKWVNKEGEPQEHTEWHKIVVWGKLAETCSRVLRKGMQVCVEGRLQTRKWQDQQGQNRYSTEVNAYTVIFLGSRSQQGQQAGDQDGGGDYASRRPSQGRNNRDYDSGGAGGGYDRGGRFNNNNNNSYDEGSRGGGRESGSAMNDFPGPGGGSDDDGDIPF